VELGEHVVEQQHRVLTVRPQQVIRGQPERERDRPALPLARIPPGGQAADPQLKVVPVRADKADHAFQFARPRPCQCLPQPGRLPSPSRSASACRPPSPAGSPPPGSPPPGSPPPGTPPPGADSPRLARSGADSPGARSPSADSPRAGGAICPRTGPWTAEDCR